MDVLISFDENKYLREKKEYESFIPAIQECVNMFNAMGLQPLEPNELTRLFKDTSGLVYDKMTEGENVSIGKFEINKSEAIKLLNKPLGYDKVMQHVQEVPLLFKTKATNWNYPNIEISHISNIFELNIEGLVILKPSKDEELQKRNKKFATSEKAKKMFALANFIIDKSKELDLEPVIKWNPDGIGKIIDGIISSKFGEGKLTLNVDEIVRYNNN